MDDVFTWAWRNAPTLDEMIRRNMLSRLRHEIDIGDWVVLGSGFPGALVEWVDDSSMPDGGRWQTRENRWQERQVRNLQWQLDLVYAQRKSIARWEEETAARADGEVTRVQPAQRVMRAAARAAPLTKAQRWRERQTLIGAGRADSSGQAQAAAERLARNNVAVEKARLADHVYDPEKPVPEGWVNRSGDVELLGRYNLKTKDLKIKGSNFQAQLYEPDPAVFGQDMKPTLAFKGTDMASLQDWGNNIAQGIDLESVYYRRAVGIGGALRDSSDPIDIAGHSLGGGLCSAASQASGKDCWSFNAAGLHPKTVMRYGGQFMPSVVNAYYVKGDILTVLQHWTTLPDAIGTSHQLPGSGSPISRHFIKQAIDGIENQKEEDISILEALP
jgi:hypothetical protein